MKRAHGTCARGRSAGGMLANSQDGDSLPARPGAGVHRERGAGPGGAERGEGGMMGTRDAEREVGTVWSLEVCRLAGAEHLPGPARQHVWARL